MPLSRARAVTPADVSTSSICGKSVTTSTRSTRLVLPAPPHADHSRSEIHRLDCTRNERYQRVTTVRVHDQHIVRARLHDPGHAPELMLLRIYHSEPDQI